MILVFALFVAALGVAAAFIVVAVGYGLALWLGTAGAWVAAILLAAGILAVVRLVVSTVRSAEGADAEVVARVFAAAYAAPLVVAVPALAYFLWRAVGAW